MTTLDRFARYSRAIEAAGCDLYLSSASADVYHLTGSEDGNAYVVYPIGQSPSLVVRASGYQCTIASAHAQTVRQFSLTEGPIPALVELVGQTRPRRVAVGVLNHELVGQLASQLSGIELAATPRLGREVRRVKEREEIAALERAAECVGAGIQAGFSAIRTGVSDREVAAVVDAAARRAGADKITFVQVKSGYRSAYPDAEEVGRVFEAGEIGFIDMGLVHGFYRGDYTRAFVIGDPPDEAFRIVETVDRIQRQTLALLRPGLACRDLYYHVRQLFAEAGYPDAVPHHLGHGLGIGDDSLPSIVPTSSDSFLDGEVVCIEPGVYVPGVGGARIEDTVIVRANGVQILSHAERVGACRKT